MCGRTAQTNHAVLAAASALASSSSGSRGSGVGAGVGAGAGERAGEHALSCSSGCMNSETVGSTSKADNFNLAPGMDAQIFLMNKNNDDNNINKGGGIEDISIHRKIWGLVPRNGTMKNPLPTGMSQHFSNLMFNARSDTLFEKSTFQALVAKGRTCLVAVDGFFEWKAPQTKGKKQPYFVYRKKPPSTTTDNNHSGKEERSYLLLAGLWTSTKTGRLDDPLLDTFTIITTASCPGLNWLHDRQPLFVWDEEVGKQWLRQPTIQLLRKMEDAAENTPSECLDWHAVTTNMSKTSYRKEDSIKALPPHVTIKSFFTAGTTTTAISFPKKTSSSSTSNSVTASLSVKAISQKKKRPATSASKPFPVTKKTKIHPSPKKKGSISSFFSPKKG